MKRRLWVLFAAGAAAVLVVMAWISREMLELEHGETAAKHEAAYERQLRQALWRLDHSFAELLRREAEREPEAYQAFNALPRKAVLAKEMKALPQDEVYQESPLLDGKPDFIQLHFQVDAGGNFSSPQVPTGAFCGLSGLTTEAIMQNGAALGHIAKLIRPNDVAEQLEEAEQQTLELEQAQGEESWQQRAQVAAGAKRGGAPQSPAVATRGKTSTGPLESFWQDGELVFLRRVRIGDARLLQGFLVDWPKLDAFLRAQIADLFPEATLRPATEESHDRRLFSLPVVLEAPAAAPAVTGRWTATHTALAIMWCVVLVAGAGAAVALKKSIDFGVRQRRFASLVTHELRSPLTTFRLYSDLLSQGLVKDEEKRHLYHRTLQQESGRMARMVENVIAHARLEEKRAQLSRRSVTLRALLEETAPALQRCAEGAGQGLALDAAAAPDATLFTDPAAVGQVLFNLVENACRYARSDHAPAIEVHAEAGAHAVHIRVRDHGPGVPSAAARRLFQPFERGGRDEADPVRGLGLGLAIGRGLAHDLGGDLALEAPAGGGACFVLTLPRVG